MCTKNTSRLDKQLCRFERLFLCYKCHGRTFHRTHASVNYKVEEVGWYSTLAVGHICRILQIGSVFVLPSDEMNRTYSTHGRQVNAKSWQKNHQED
jgi:hypothetical protein